MLVTFIPAFVSQAVKNWEDPLQELVEGLDEDGDEYARITEKYRASHQPIPRGTIKLVADHIEHVRDVAGIDHVGSRATGAVGRRRHPTGWKGAMHPM